MKKFNKLLALATSIILVVGAFRGLNASAASSFSATDANFKAVFDFDQTPGVYTNGDATVGTRTDTVGDSKSEKCIDAQGIGLSYKLLIDNSNSAKGNALKLDVTDLAPEDGAYCPISFNVRYGTNKLINVEGATDFMFWCDTTGFKDGYSNQKGIILYIQEANVLADGSVTSDGATAWKPKKGTDGGYYLYEDGNGGWAKQTTNDTDFYLPVNYRGWIKMPMNAFTYCDWNGETVNNHFYGKQIQVVQFGMGNYARQKGSVIYFDELGFTGDFSKSSPQTVTSSKTATTANHTNTSSIASVTSSDVPSDESSYVSSDGESSDIVSTETEKNFEDGEDEEEKSETSLLWLWIVLAVVAVLAIAFVCFYFFYVKKKNPDFFKNMFKKN